MFVEIDPKEFNLSSRIKLRGDISKVVQIIKKRKSRIIMKDGLQLLDIANSIHKVNPEVKIEIIVSGPVCSKTTKFLADNDILVKNDL
jgi:cephalosporin-C deacetylase-like acetyl esterase